MFIPSGYKPIDTMHKGHCNLKASSSQAKIFENFADSIFKTIDNNKCFIDLKGVETLPQTLII